MSDVFGRTDAPGSYAGFEYQFLIFLRAVLSLHVGESVGFEHKDDVSTVTSSGYTTLIQTKHTILKNAKGGSTNLINLDPDLWKTISNWLSLFYYPSYVDFSKIDKSKPQQPVVLKTSFEKYNFILVTNKGITRDAKYLEIFSSANIDEKITQLAELSTSTESAEIKSQIEYLRSLKKEELDAFTCKVSISNSQGEVMLQIKNLMKEKYVPEDRMELLVGLIYKRLKDYAFDLISDGKAVDVSFDKQFALFSKYFLYAKSNFNPLNRMRSSHAILQVNPKEQVFIRQLTDIDCISESKFMDLMHVLLNFQQYIEQGLIEGAIIPEEVDELDKNAELIWGAIFQNAYDEIERRRRLAQSVDEKEIDAIARKIYHQIQGQHISQESFPLDNRLSFGEFLKLSDQPKIGWHIDWEMRYAK